MPSFKVPCPSCEASVLIKNPNLVGTKVECPKCKYRFKVEAPTDDAASDAGTPAKAAKTPEPANDGGADAGKKKGRAKNQKVLIGAGVGAVVLLGVVGYVVFGGDGKGFTLPDIRRTKPGDNTTQGGDNPDTKGQTPSGPTIPRSDVNPTNLLPGQSVAVYRFDIEKLRQTPVAAHLFDAAMVKLFESSMGFEVALVEQYFHCSVGTERAPFGVIRLREPREAKDITGKMVGLGQAKGVNGKTVQPVKGNAFLTAIGQSFAARSLLADLYDSLPGPAPNDKPLGVCVYDNQTVFVGDLAVVEAFIGELKNGYPEFRSKLLTGSSESPPAGNAREYTNNPNYLSVEPDLKRMLNALEEDITNPPMLVLAEKFDLKAYDPGKLKKSYQGLGSALTPILSHIDYIGVNLSTFTNTRLLATIRISSKTADEARTIAVDQLTPALAAAVPVVSLFLYTPIEFRNYAATMTGGPGIPGTPYPGGPGGAGPGGPGPGGPPGGSGIPPSGGSAGGPPTGGSAGGPPIGSGSGTKPGGSGGGPPGPMGGSAGGPPMPGGAGGGPMPGGAGGGPTPPGTPPGSTPPGTVDPSQPINAPSHIDLRFVDQVVTITIDLALGDDSYGRVLAPRLFGMSSQLKGKMTVYSGDYSIYTLAGAVARIAKEGRSFPQGALSRPRDINRLGLDFPAHQRLSFFVDLLPYLGRDAVNRSVNRTLSWADEKNMAAAESWIPELLVSDYTASAWRAISPLGDGRVFGGTNWVAVAGVGPEAARYDPQRKILRYKAGSGLGGVPDKEGPATEWVTIGKPDHAKLAGMTGYDWGSRPDDVTDGLDKTIYLIQLPPWSPRPWLAGGGSTVVGLNPENPMAEFAHPRPDGKIGTYAIMGDGSVRWIPAEIEPRVLLALATRAGGESLPDNLDEIAPRVEPVKKDPEPKAPVTATPSTPMSAAPMTTVPPPATGTPTTTPPMPADKKDTAPTGSIPPPREK